MALKIYLDDYYYTNQAASIAITLSYYLAISDSVNVLSRIKYSS